MKRSVVLAFVLLGTVALFSAMEASYVSSAPRLNQVLTSTLSTGVSTSVIQPGQIWNAPFTVLSTTGTNLLCELWALNFNATTGQYLSGMFNSDTPVSFFVVQQGTYQSWVKAGTCGNAGDAIASQLISTSYIFSAVAIPSSGTWTIVIVNASNARNADGYLLAYVSATGYTVTQPLTGTITTTITSTSNVVGGQSIPSIAGFPVAAIIIGIMAGLVAVTILRRRNHR